MKTILVAAMACVILIAGGCSTSTHFRLPPETAIQINGGNEAFTSGPAKTRPFFWGSFNGVDYVLFNSKDGSVAQEGKLSTNFRIASIFWPPYAIAYWPLGFKCACYDLTKAQPQCCFPGVKPRGEETENR